MNYGLPYKGSKNLIVSKLCEILPNANTLYDLFAGGCSVTDYCMSHNKYRHYIINDIAPTVNVFKNAINGVYKDRYEWVSREEFNNSNDYFIKLLWSFGNNCRNYLYSKECEPYKKAMHYAIVFNDWKYLEELNIDCSELKRKVNSESDISKRKSIIVRNVKLHLMNLEHLKMQNLENLERLESLGRVQNLERLERVESLESLGRVQNLEIYNTDYQKVPLTDKNGIIYCDIPYKNTNKYQNEFDYERFYTWAENQQLPIYISEYSMPEDRFTCIATINKRSTISATANNAVIERIFRPTKQLKIELNW